MQMVKESTRRDVLLDLVLKNNKGLAGNVEAGDSLECSNLEIVEFRILHRKNKTVSKIATLEFRKANSNLFKDLPGGIP